MDSGKRFQEGARGNPGVSVSDLDVATVFVPKASDVLAARLREMILSKGAPEGTALPTERELVAQSGLSRASVREALRVLETEGLIVTKVGRNGGSVTKRPGHEAISRSLDLFVRSHGVRVGALIEAREAIEPAAARLAALHRSTDDIAELRRLNALLAPLPEVTEFVRVNYDWHLAVVKASRNELMLAFFSALADPLYAATEYQSLTTPELRREVVLAHDRVIEAIAEGDPDRAFRRMLRHVGAYIGIVRNLSADAAKAYQPSNVPME